MEVTIACDGCMQIMGGARTAGEVRRTLARDWPGCRVGLPGGRDLCDECAGSTGEEER